MVTEESVSKDVSRFSKLSSSIKLPETIHMMRKDARIAAVLYVCLIFITRLGVIHNYNTKIP